MIILVVNILVNCNHRILSEGVDMISVIMLTFNREMYVGNMIEDILGQTYADFEYVIVNNGSTDGTEERLAEYAKSDQRIRVLPLLDRKSPRLNDSHTKILGMPS